MVNINEILKNVMSSKQAVFIKVPFPLTVSADDFSELKSKLGEKVLKECYEQALREATAELVTATRKASLSVPIHEKVNHEVRGEFADEVLAETKQDIASKRILEFLEKEGRVSTSTLRDTLDIDNTIIYNALYSLEAKNLIQKHKNIDGHILWGLPESQEELREVLPKGTRVSVFGGSVQ